MKFNYNVTGSERKRLVTAISEIIDAPVKYLGVPSFAYEVDYVAVDKNGIITFDERTDRKEIETVVERLLEMGFESEGTDNGPAEVDGVCISMPRSLFSEAALANLNALVTAKGVLIRKALGVMELPIEVTSDKVSFPWFVGQPTPEEIKAYEHFICALCKLACNQKRITAKEKETDNDKYAFRCFLLRLGFIGTEYKLERKILLRNLSGSSAFKGGDKHEISK